MSRPWMPLYVGDYLKNTRHLSAAEHGAYLLLIMSYWEDDGLPQDERQIMRLTAMTEKEWKASRNTIAAFFDPGWRHPRIDAEIAEAEAKHNRRSDAGRLGGKAKRNGSNASSNATVPDTENPKRNGSNAEATYAGDAGGNSQPQPQKEDNPKPQQPTTSVAPAAAAKPGSVSEAVAQAMARRGQPSPLHELADLCHEALGIRGKVPPALEFMGPIEDLIEAKWSLDRHILPALRDAAKKGKPGNTWAYYVKIITNGASEPPKAPPPPPSAAPTVDLSPAGLSRIARVYAACGQYPYREIAEPGTPGSPVTAEMVAEARRQSSEEARRVISRNAEEAA